MFFYFRLPPAEPLPADVTSRTIGDPYIKLEWDVLLAIKFTQKEIDRVQHEMHILSYCNVFFIECLEYDTPDYIIQKESVTFVTKYRPLQEKINTLHKGHAKLCYFLYIFQTACLLSS